MFMVATARSNGKVCHRSMPMADGRFKRSLHARQWGGIVPCSPVLPAVPG
jgi:hypothetical protein